MDNEKLTTLETENLDDANPIYDKYYEIVAHIAHTAQNPGKSYNGVSEHSLLSPMISKLQYRFTNGTSLTASDVSTGRNAQNILTDGTYDGDHINLFMSMRCGWDDNATSSGVRVFIPVMSPAVGVQYAIAKQISAKLAQLYGVTNLGVWSWGEGNPFKRTDGQIPDWRFQSDNIEEMHNAYVRNATSGGLGPSIIFCVQPVFLTDILGVAAYRYDEDMTAWTIASTVVNLNNDQDITSPTFSPIPRISIEPITGMGDAVYEGKVKVTLESVHTDMYELRYTYGTRYPTTWTSVKNTGGVFEVDVSTQRGVTWYFQGYGKNNNSSSWSSASTTLTIRSNRLPPLATSASFSTEYLGPITDVTFSGYTYDNEWSKIKYDVFIKRNDNINSVVRIGSGLTLSSNNNTDITSRTIRNIWNNFKDDPVDTKYSIVIISNDGLVTNGDMYTEFGVSAIKAKAPTDPWFTSPTTDINVPEGRYTLAFNRGTYNGSIGGVYFNLYGDDGDEYGDYGLDNYTPQTGTVTFDMDKVPGVSRYRVAMMTTNEYAMYSNVVLSKWIILNSKPTNPGTPTPNKDYFLNTVTFTWTASTTTGGTAIKYKVWKAVNGNIMSLLSENVTTNSYTYTTSSSDSVASRISIYVTAYDGYGLESDQIQGLNSIKLAALTSPDIIYPTINIISKPEDIRIEWKKVTMSAEKGYYLIEYDKNGSGTWRTYHETVDENTTSILFVNIEDEGYSLREGDYIKFRVKAIDNAGIETSYTAATTTGIIKRNYVPIFTESLISRPSMYADNSVAWTIKGAADLDTTQKITYKIYIRKTINSVQGQWILSNNVTVTQGVNPTMEYANIASDPIGTRYDLRVVYEDECGEGGTVTVTSLPIYKSNRPTMPGNLQPMTPDGQTSRRFLNSIPITWTHSDFKGSTGKYELTVYANNAQVLKTDVANSINSYNFDITGYARGTSFYFTLRAINQYGDESILATTVSGSVARNLKPSAPTIVYPVMTSTAQFPGTRCKFNFSASSLYVGQPVTVRFKHKGIVYDSKTNPTLFTESDITGGNYIFITGDTLVNGDTIEVYVHDGLEESDKYTISNIPVRTLISSSPLAGSYVTPSHIKNLISDINAMANRYGQNTITSFDSSLVSGEMITADAFATVSGVIERMGNLIDTSVANNKFKFNYKAKTENELRGSMITAEDIKNMCDALRNL